MLSSPGCVDLALHSLMPPTILGLHTPGLHPVSILSAERLALLSSLSHRQCTRLTLNFSLFPHPESVRPPMLASARRILPPGLFLDFDCPSSTSLLFSYTDTVSKNKGECRRWHSFYSSIYHFPVIFSALNQSHAFSTTGPPQWLVIPSPCQQLVIYCHAGQDHHHHQSSQMARSSGVH